MAELHTFYYEFPDGRLGKVETTDPAPAPPDGATVIDEATYNVKLAQWQAAQDQQQADTVAAETAKKKDAYDALVAAGFTPAVASTLSGYTPPAA
ncbi:hypothetical protein ABT301_29680 [Streptomyces sp. NPDC000987]|uniref:hypothetical protein n=1 Tax=Streptomyces sp. NPDC000987 TaxID=3154374 RepID=UPI00331ECB3B